MTMPLHDVEERVTILSSSRGRRGHVRRPDRWDGSFLPPGPRRLPRQRSRRLPTAIDDIDLEADSTDRYL